MATLQFLLSRTVADALPIDQIAARARAANIERPRLEYNAKNAGGQLRITCQTPMAEFLREQLQTLASTPRRDSDSQRSQWLVDCAMAIDNVTRAIAESDGPGRAHGIPASPY